MTPRVYIAAPKAEAPRARAVAEALRAARVEVVSRWHAVYEDGAPDPRDPEVGLALLSNNRADLGRANVVVALTADGVGAETYAEIREAQLLGHRVVWSAQRGGLALCCHDPSVRVVPLDYDAVRMVVTMAAGPSPCGVCA